MFLCTAKLHGLEEHKAVGKCFSLSPFLKRLVYSSCSQHKTVMFYQAAEKMATLYLFIYLFIKKLPLSSSKIPPTSICRVLGHSSVMAHSTDAFFKKH